MRLLLGSGGMSTEARRARWKEAFDAFLGEARRFVFVPHAADMTRRDRYLEVMRAWHPEHEVLSVHESDDPVALLEEAQAIYVGGGNSFLLLRDMQAEGLLEPIRRRVRAGTPYVGVSAGTNMACPTMRTTNDMPVVTPGGLDTLDLVPFQVNPHYFAGPIYIETEDGHVPYGGETRDDRLREYLQHNDLPVIGLWEGGWLRVEDGAVTLGGAPARLFRRGEEPLDLEAGASLDALLAGARA